MVVSYTKRCMPAWYAELADSGNWGDCNLHEEVCQFGTQNWRTVVTGVIVSYTKRCVSLVHRTSGQW